MPALNILIGGESFREIRERDCFYVDKTDLLEELLASVPPKVSLITRPRRFGKTLTMSMLRDFFDIQKDSRDIFKGLKVAHNKELCDEWMNKHPVVFLSLKYVEGKNFDHAVAQFASLISRVCTEHSYLNDSAGVTAADKQEISELIFKQADVTALENSLLTLCRALQNHWGKPVILLIDEYDVPLACAQQNGYYHEMVSFIRNMLGAALKTNEALQFAILTGCLRIAKESIFTGLNNFKCYGISEVKFADKFGFTSSEVDDILAKASFSSKKEEMKEWYDGYRFGNDQEMYCPWDILQYVNDLCDNPKALPQAYWNNTSGNAIVRSFIGRTDLNISEKFEALINGGCVAAKIVESLTYDSLHSSEENLWSLLYLTGYLTKASEEQIEACGRLADDDKTFLVIPNKEVRKIFTESIASWFTDTMLEMDRRPLFESFWSGDADKLSRLVSRILLNTISYHDYKEDFYHAVLTGIFVGSGYAVTSNRESGRGRADIIVKDQRNSRSAVIEVKHANTSAELAPLAEAALQQIDDKEYDAPLRDNYETVIHWGMAFFEKRCIAKFKAAVSQ